MDWTYPAAPLAGYLAAGGLKFVLNSLAARRPVLNQIGLGGFPSTHTSIVAAVAMLVGLKDGFGTAAFAVALGLAMVVVIDAMDLRRRIGHQATALRRLFPDHDATRALRERIGHRPVEVLGGGLVGMMVAALLAMVAP